MPGGGRVRRRLKPAVVISVLSLIVSVVSPFLAYRFLVGEVRLAEIKAHALNSRGRYQENIEGTTTWVLEVENSGPLGVDEFGILLQPRVDPKSLKVDPPAAYVVEEDPERLRLQFKKQLPPRTKITVVVTTAKTEVSQLFAWIGSKWLVMRPVTWTNVAGPSTATGTTSGGAAEPASKLIEDWVGHRADYTGIPEGWKGQSWGDPKTDLGIAVESGRRALRLRSHNESSIISKELGGRIDLNMTPILEWSWKVMKLPKGGNACVKANDDQATQVYVAWPRFPENVRSQVIGYVWDTTASIGTICKSEKTPTVVYVVVRSGAGDLGRWITERRNVREDFKKIYREEPERPGAVLLAIDSNDTKSAAESYVAQIRFTNR